jgi:hypothetical protein
LDSKCAEKPDVDLVEEFEVFEKGGKNCEQVETCVFLVQHKVSECRFREGYFFRVKKIKNRKSVKNHVDFSGGKRTQNFAQLMAWDSIASAGTGLKGR